MKHIVNRAAISLSQTLRAVMLVLGAGLDTALSAYHHAQTQKLAERDRERERDNQTSS